MALKACSRITGIIPRILINRHFVPLGFAPWTSWSNLFATNSRCFLNTRFARTEILRRFSSSTQPDSEISYEQLKQLLAARSGVVIDVREPWELREYGIIHGSVNVPLGQLSRALQLNPEEFKEKYGADMPRQNENLVFSCLAGVRSKTALDSAVSLGYTRAQHYPGGWQDWAKNEQIESKH